MLPSTEFTLVVILLLVALLVLTAEMRYSQHSRGELPEELPQPQPPINQQEEA